MAVGSHLDVGDLCEEVIKLLVRAVLLRGNPQTGLHIVAGLLLLLPTPSARLYQREGEADGI